MNQEIHNPHDKLFKQAMSDTRVAIDFFKHHLPEKIQSLVDFSTLELQKETFIDKEFKLSAADVVYKAKMAGATGYLSIIAEQQTKVEKWLPLQIARYRLNFLEHHHQQYPLDELPLVYVLIFYNGREPYLASTDFFDLFGEQKKLASEIFNTPLLLIDVQKVPDTEMKRHFWSGILEFIYKHRFHHFLRFIDEIFCWFRLLEEKEGADYARIMLKYMLNHLDGRHEQQLIDSAQQHLTPKLGEEVMTFAERFEQRGYKKGLEEAKTFAQRFEERGYEKGLEEGKTLAQRFEERGYEKGLEEGKTFAQRFEERGYEKGLEEGKTLAQRFEERGYEKGIEEGKTFAQQFEERGYEKGLKEGISQVLNNLLLQGMSASQISQVTGIAIEKVQQLLGIEIV